MKKEEVYLFGRRLTGLDKDILDNFDYERLISKENLSNQCNKFMLYGLIGVGGIWAVIFAIIIIVKFKIKKSESKILALNVMVSQKKIVMNA